MKTIQEMRAKYWQPGDVFCPKVKSPERLEVRITEPMVLVNRDQFKKAQIVARCGGWKQAMSIMMGCYEIPQKWWDQF
jgi:hypothetical protein